MASREKQKRSKKSHQQARDNEKVYVDEGENFHVHLEQLLVVEEADVHLF
jgi:hypothetical protein